MEAEQHQQEQQQHQEGEEGKQERQQEEKEAETKEKEKQEETQTKEKTQAKEKQEDGAKGGQEQILSKLGELPIVSDTCAQVADLYQRTKGHNFLFRTYFGLAEYTAKAVADRAVPIIYSSLRSPLDKMNDVACSQLGALEEKFPIITKPTEEVLREGQEQYDKVRPIVDPLVVKPAMAALDIGKTAVTTAVAPAKYAVHVGSAVTSSVIDTGKQAATDVASSVMTKGQQVVDAGLSTSLGQFWVQQFDSALDATEKLVLHHCLPEQGKESGEEKKTEAGGEEEGDAGGRMERVSALLKMIHSALCHKAEGDMVRYRMMAGNLLHEIIEISGFYLALAKDSTEKGAKDRQEVLEAFSRVWNKYAHYIPEAARPEDPVKRVVVVLGTLTSKLGELFSMSTELSALVNKHLSAKSQEFMAWCQQSSAVLKERVAQGGQGVKERYADYMEQLTSYLPHIMEMVQFLTDKILHTLDVLGVVSKLNQLKPADIPKEKEEEIEMSELPEKSS